MSEKPTDKYKMFRNFMCNELGISRQDIETWTKEAVAVEVNKKLGQINVEEIMKSTMEDVSRRALNISSYDNRPLREAVAAKLAERLILQISKEEK